MWAIFEKVGQDPEKFAMLFASSPFKGHKYCVQEARRRLLVLCPDQSSNSVQQPPKVLWRVPEKDGTYLVYGPSENDHDTSCVMVVRRKTVVGWWYSSIQEDIVYRVRHVAVPEVKLISDLTAVDASIISASSTCVGPVSSSGTNDPVSTLVADACGPVRIKRRDPKSPHDALLNAIDAVGGRRGLRPVNTAPQPPECLQRSLLAGADALAGLSSLVVENNVKN